jgi:hypothetical protein
MARKVLLPNLNLLRWALKDLPTAYCFPLSPFNPAACFICFHTLSGFGRSKEHLSLGQRPGWDFLLFFRGVASRHDGRRLKACIFDMTRPFRAGRELPC